MSAPLRIGMWSGPRNISTAMMRAWENRGDCTVTDEPLYAHYLAATGADHPAREEVIAAGDTDWRRVVAGLLGPIPDGRPIWYQKHMCHHLLPDMDREWIGGLTNVFLIRDPSAVVASYLKTRDSVCAADIGLPQQIGLFEWLSGRNGAPPPVIDAGAFLAEPERHLRALCGLLAIEFHPAMLKWPPGSRASDGVWAPHWYDAVWQSTGFDKPQSTRAALGPDAARVVDECHDAYAALYGHRLQVD